LTPSPPRRRVTPYGSWSSPIAPETVAEAGFLFGQLGQVALGPAGLFWLEARAAEGGRSALMRAVAGGPAEEAGPAGADVRTRVHEYGGGAYAVHGQVVWLSAADDRVYRHDLVRGETRPAVPAAAAGTSERYADFDVAPDGLRLAAVRETHARGEVVNELVALAADGAAAPSVLATGRDFYAAPRFSPDGRRLAWLSWDHPAMPWDGASLWLATLGDDGRPRDARVVAGSAGESVQQPVWSPDGTLHFVSDRSGWWSLYRLADDDGIALVAGGERELGFPGWRLGLSTYAFLDDGTICCIARERSGQRVCRVAPDGSLEDLGLPYDELLMPCLAAYGRELAFVGATGTTAPALVHVDVDAGDARVVASSRVPTLPDGVVSPPRRMTFDSDGRPTHLTFYAPANPAFDGPEDGLPPLIVNVHGGPTAMSFACLDLAVQFWTSRGFAYADVDYGGSAGYGRDYRERLRGQWGVLDVRDCVNAAAHLARAGLVDPRRHAIRGPSAGGFTTLCALAFTDAFQAGASSFGIADLETMIAGTHKFERHYLDGLLGVQEDMRPVYAARSPIRFADRISSPLALLQGEDDAIVPADQATAMAQTLRSRGVEVALHVFPGERHGFHRAETIARALAAEHALLARALGVDG